MVACALCSHFCNTLNTLVLDTLLVVALLTMIVLVAGRIVYFIGYSSKGPNGRLPGTIVSNLTQIGVLGFLLVQGGRTVLGA